ncbi:hypothetical protein SUDANB95_02010 [Actinosynnema sp. ALI-1.44]
MDVLASSKIRTAADHLLRATLGANITIRSGDAYERTRSEAVDAARRAKEAFLGEVRAELGVDAP